MKTRRIQIAAVMAAVLALWLFLENNTLTVSQYTVASSRLPEEFAGFRIAQVSDLHNASFGENNQRLLAELQKAEPDIIVLTGDLVDSRRTDIEVAVSFAAQAVKIAPCYYVTGNHEARISQLAELLDPMAEAGVTLLRNETVTLNRGDSAIALVGVDDPSFQTDYLRGNAAHVLEERLNILLTDEHPYTILLSHRPELFDLHCRYDLDLVFSGHAHGGQFRLPFLGGLIAPNQGLFPKFDAGIFQKGRTSMVVSRGLGASIIPIRMGNPPEIVVIQLCRQEA